MLLLFAYNFFIYGIPEPYNVKEQLFNVLSERQAIPECPPASNSPSLIIFSTVILASHSFLQFVPFIGVVVRLS